MGIQGLLPLLKSIQKPCNLKKFTGQTIGVDVYGWLHRGTVACAMELALEKPTSKFVDFAMHRVRMLQHFGITPYIVFDGDYLPSKAATEAGRAKRREESRAAGLELHRLGKVSQAYLELQKAVDVSPEMARQLMDELKRLDIKFVVAPYEADAQLAFLEREGHISAIISEDSDMLVFGTRCLLTKLDQYGDCVEINRKDFAACREISLVGWSDADFRNMAILSGCDYLPSINKMGLKTAYRLVRKHKTIDRIVRSLQFDGQFRVPNGYLDAFRLAELTFLHQWVFCPKRQMLVMNMEIADESKGLDLGFLGEHFAPEIAIGIATGHLNPISKEILKPRNKPLPTTPWTNKLRTGRALSTGDLQTIDNMKGHKSIDSFFKSKRVPLSELDPNSFTPSPQQQRTLEQNAGAIWSSSPASEGVSVQRPASNTNSRQTPRIGSGLREVQRPSRDFSSAANSSIRPKKRARLCSDESEKSGAGPFDCVETAKSRFFTSSAPEPSPSRRKDVSRRKNKKKDIYIFSDDSIEEDLRCLPDLCNSSEQPYTEANPEGTERKAREVNDQVSEPKSFLAKLEGPVTQEDSSTRQGVLQTDESLDNVRSADTRGSVANTELQSLQAKFSYNPEQLPKENPADSSSKTPEESNLASRAASHPEETDTATLRPPEPSKPRMTALQRLGVGAMHRVRPQDLLQKEAVIETLSCGDILQLDFGVSKNLNGEENLPRPVQAGLCGSEDFIIPDSDQEDCSLSPASPESSCKTTLDLSKFAFTAQ